MGITEADLRWWLSGYNPNNIMIGVVASHSALQILHGAKKEGFKTLGIAVGADKRRLYSALPGSEPDEWLMLDDYQDLKNQEDWLKKKNVVIIPHGSLKASLSNLLSNFPVKI